MQKARKSKINSNITPVGADHRWIIDVVTDLETYAANNDLSQVQASAIAMLAVARRDIFGESDCA